MLLRADSYCRWAIEVVLLVQVAGSPWALAGVYPGAEMALRVGTALVVVLWAARTVLGRAGPLLLDPVLAGLAGLTLLTAFQLVPLPGPVLGVISPNTLEANLKLRPAVGEALPGETQTARPTAFPLSLSPPDTRDAFTELFAITLLYAAARANLTGRGALVRLAWVVTVTAGLLSVVGVAQLVSPGPSSVALWSIPTEGQVFGPFVNRNHYPFYAAVGLGLGAALLADRFRGGVGEFLNRPAGVWLLTLVSATAAGIAVCRSRGGAVAALAAAAGCLLVWFRDSRRPTGLGWVLWVGLLAAAGGTWVGWSAVAARLGTLEAGRLSDETRAELWAGDLGVFLRHPVFGTGAGTHRWVEPAGRVTAGNEDLTAEHAHNEYVEALVEGGVVRLALTGLMVGGFVGILARRYRSAPPGLGRNLWLGGLFAAFALAAHSLFDFGIHLPAIYTLAAITGAALLGATDSSDREWRPAPRWARAPAAAALIAAAGLLVWDGLTTELAERSRWAARGLSGREVLSAAEAERAVRLLSAAAAARPHRAEYHHELGQAYLARALTRPPGSAGRTADLSAALREWRTARDLSPVMAPTHARLGHYGGLFAQADPPAAYLARARRLMPTDPEMAYLSGRARWDAGDVEGAAADWRAALAGSDARLADIVRAAAARLGAAGVLNQVLPDDPARIERAAELLFPAGSPDAAGRRAYLERARTLVLARAEKTAADWALEGRLEGALGEPARAATAFQNALALDPRQTGWRLARAAALQDAGDLDAAARELEAVLTREPNHRAARDRLDVVRREIELRGP